ncbi:hypothetical protein CsSME_00042593 [Camellia sinensis var. sinensis]
MSQKIPVSPSLQAIKSLPVDFRFMGSPTPRPSESFDAVNPSNSNMIPNAIPENGDVAREVVEGSEEVNNNMVPDNDESPYSRFNVTVEARPSVGDEDLDLATTPLRPFAPLRTESKWSDTTPYSAKKKLQSWIQLSNGNWELGKVLSTSGTESVVSLSEGKVLKVNSESLLPANPDILDGVDDLMQLSYLNEPSVLYNLQYRYNQDVIYTKAGPVLVAINPFKKVPLYGDNYIEAYKRKSTESPHVYAITDTAIREMRRGGLSLFLFSR